MQHSDGLTELKRITDTFERRWNAERTGFYLFLLSIRALVDQQVVSELDAAQAIAGCVFIPGVDDDPLRDEITIVAADLESRMLDPKHSWDYLCALIDELGQQAE